MKLNDYQRGAKQFAVYPGAKIPESYELTPPAIYPFLGLSEESGEVMGKLAKVFRGDHDSIDREAIGLELGDVLWQLSECCRQVGLDLETVAMMNLDKLTDRQARNKIRGEGDGR
jgi:NTP pyrophosphatase (non-canonical NTP hydrolase)